MPPIKERKKNLLEDVYLKTPDFSDKNIVSFNVGIRPYRKSGLRLESEFLQDKIIIHNYGYGGSGLTLCFGGANEVMQLLKLAQEKNPHLLKIKTVAVLGAGVIGLTTAYELLGDGYEVNVYADKFSPHLTSNVAAGILSPPADNEILPHQKDLLDRMLALSLKRFKFIGDSANPELKGVQHLTDYRFELQPGGTLAKKLKEPFIDEKKVRVHFDNGLTKTGRRVRALGLDGKIFMHDLNTKVQTKGAIFHRRHFADLLAIDKLKEKIIINCTSMGSRILFNDQDLFPVRGHHIHIKSQEGIDYALYQDIALDSNYWIKLYPWSDRLILGGVFEYGKEACTIDHAVVSQLLEYARKSLTLEKLIET